jgi:endoglucanase
MNKEFLVKLCGANGVSGHETAVSDLILSEIKSHIDDHKIDALGNLIAHKKGPGKKMMLAGHMDQIGLMVTFIEKEGFLRFSPIGGHSPDNVLHQRFVFPNGTYGVVSTERLDDPSKKSLDKLYIDIGVQNEEEAKKYVKIGDVCGFATVPVVNNEVFITPSLDDRIGCFVMVEALKKIKNPAFDLYFVFTTQEEVGLRGARTSAYAIEPDYGLAFDVTISADTPKARKFPSKMHGGAAIKLKDASLLCHPTIIKHLEDCAKTAGIKYQFEILEAGGTDSGAIHTTKGGVPSGVISISSRYIHSANEMCALSDVEDCISLTVKALDTKIG